MQATHAASNTGRQILPELDGRRYSYGSDDLEGGRFRPGSIRLASTDGGCCSHLFQRVTDWSSAHPRIGYGLCMFGGLLFIAGGAITLAHNPDAKLVAALSFVAGGTGVIGTALHCYLGRREEF